MELLQTSKISCPYCGELIELLIDCSIPQQSYIEDCAVCCSPIHLDISANESVSIIAKSENE
jgi:hypothetical protein